MGLTAAFFKEVSGVSSMVRDQVLEKWLGQVLGTPAFIRRPLAGDASFRRYDRIAVAEKSYVLMDAPPPEIPGVFAEIAALLEKQGLSVPRVLHQDLGHGFLVLSDLGDRLYLNELNEHTADRLYQDAFDALLEIQARVVAPCGFSAFDRAFLKRQLNIFEEWYLEKHKALPISEEIQALLTPIYEHLFQVIECQPQVFVHRDYHSRNLMILEEGSPGILDFQDAMIGPITYDLVSLLQDCYISWPRERVVDWVESVRVESKHLGLLKQSTTAAEFLQWFDWTGLQRHLKNLGIFARLYYRDQKSGYLKDIPQLLHYITETCDRYVELKPLQQFLETLPETVRA